MKTASFFTYTGAGRVSIARYPPRGTPAGFRVFKELAPRQDMLKMPYRPYRTCYFGDIVGRLDPRQVWDRLHEMAGGAEPVLLCWEKPPFHPDNWCHRHMVAEWLGDTLGVEVPELGRLPQPAPPPAGDVLPFIGREALIDGVLFRVEAPDKANPGQALVGRHDSGEVFSVSLETLRDRFPG